MRDRYSDSRMDDSRNREMRPQLQQDRSQQWDRPSNVDSRTWSTDGRDGRDDWRDDRSQGRDEFRGDRSYQNAMEEERGRNFSNGSDRGYNGSYGDNRSLRNTDGYSRSDRRDEASYGFNPDRWNEGSYSGSNQWQSGGNQWQSGNTQQQRGQHYGKGPKGYTRSDDRLKEDLSDRFMAHGDLDASDIEMDVNQGEVTLRGNVDSRESRRLAEDLCEDCHGVRQVNNQLRVSDSWRSASGPSGRSSNSTDARDDASVNAGRNRDKSDKSH